MDIIWIVFIIGLNSMYALEGPYALQLKLQQYSSENCCPYIKLLTNIVVVKKML